MTRSRIIAACAIAIALPLCIANSPLRLVTTDSIPLGLYVATSNTSAPFVEFCLDEAAAVAAIHAGLQIDAGSCPGGIEPLLKPVIRATATWPVDLSAAGIAVAGHLLPNTEPKAVSRTGKPLTHYPFGHYTGGLWAVSGYSKDSFDSRYFGPVDPKNIKDYARPLLTRE